MKVNILTRGFLSPNARGWLYSIIKHIPRLSERGIDLSFYLKNSEEVKFCDVVIVESKFVRDYWIKDEEKIFKLLINLKTKNNKVFFFDLGDSTYSWDLAVLPYVDKFLKPYIFKDRTNYFLPLDECNNITNYYQKRGMINYDTFRMPHFLKKGDKKLLDKIQVGFNYVFADYSCNSNLWKHDYFNRLARRSFKIFNKIMKIPKSYDFVTPSINRKQDLSCRILLNKYSNGINFHREETAKILSNQLSTNKINRKDYFSEIQNSKVVVSPFGWGEINLPRDYEVALSGSVLFKPDISHIDTWPNIFNKDTVVQYKWDLSNLLELVEKTISNYDEYIQYAIRLQNEYRQFSFNQFGTEKFCDHFIKILEN
ncbi:hypothetical protein IDH26_04500 [Pelagibacterales bacterium SAG-MED50]|nr:hypothetical protein [Pelagibacterales bacterium SAG-MED50]